MRASIESQLGAGLHPREAGRPTLRAVPPLAVEDARRRRSLEVTLGDGHPAGALMARNFEPIPGCFSIRTAGPWTGQIAVLVTVLKAALHWRAHATPPAHSTVMPAAPPAVTPSTPPTRDAATPATGENLESVHGGKGGRRHGGKGGWRNGERAGGVTGGKGWAAMASCSRMRNPNES